MLRIKLLNGKNDKNKVIHCENIIYFLFVVRPDWWHLTLPFILNCSLRKEVLINLCSLCVCVKSCNVLIKCRQVCSQCVCLGNVQWKGIFFGMLSVCLQLGKMWTLLCNDGQLDALQKGVLCLLRQNMCYFSIFTIFLSLNLPICPTW